jgi:hypothetical protein
MDPNRRCECGGLNQTPVGIEIERWEEECVIFLHKSSSIKYAISRTETKEPWLQLYEVGISGGLMKSSSHGSLFCHSVVKVRTIC